MRGWIAAGLVCGLLMAVSVAKAREPEVNIVPDANSRPCIYLSQCTNLGYELRSATVNTDPANGRTVLFNLFLQRGTSIVVCKQPHWTSQSDHDNDPQGAYCLEIAR